jgi:hypothetical protein
LILIGTQEDNRLIKEKFKYIPVDISKSGIEIFHHQVARGENAIKFIFPEHDFYTGSTHRVILFSTGTSSKYALLSEAFIPFSVFSALPDYMVFDEQIRDHGFAGVKSAGYFDFDWEFDENLSYY